MSYKDQLCYNLQDGNKMPAIGYGTARAFDEELEKALNKALEVGYRCIDTATVYKNEHVIGKVLQQWFLSGKLKREDIFIVTKLPRCGLRPAGVEKYLKRSLEALKLDYVGLYLIHGSFGHVEDDNFEAKTEDGKFVIDFSTDLIGTWKAMEAQVDAGRTKSIGVSNLNREQIQRILASARIPPANLQVELHIYLQQPELVAFCKNHNIVVTSYATLGSGEWSAVPGNNRLPSILKNPVVNKIARKYGKSAAQILLRFFIQSGIVVIPKSTNENRLQENFQVFDFQIDDKDIEELKVLDVGEDGRRYVLEEMAPGSEKHPEYPYPLRQK